MLTCMTAILMKRIGKHSDPILVGNLIKSSKIPTRSHQDLEAPFHNMITSRSTSSPGTLFSTSPGEMSLLALTPSSVTHQPSMIVVLWPNSSLDETLWYAMPMASKHKKQFTNTLYDNIRFRGAMTTLITDGGRYEISKRVADLLRNLFIKQHESEPYHQHQNKAEQRYGVVKRYINTLMNLTGAPAHCCLLCMLYVCHLLNATASPALGGLTPLQALTG